jgi:trans-aconitate methyltransferase
MRKRGSAATIDVDSYEGGTKMATVTEPGRLDPEKLEQFVFTAVVGAWLPALDGVVSKLERGARVADVGCGHGSSTILMAQAFPESTFAGSDYHDGSIATARTRAEAAGVGDRVSFEAAPAGGYSGSGYDLITMFDSLHDTGDPVGAARHVHETLDQDGTWMLALGAQAGEARIREVVETAGFTRFRRAAETPLNLVFEVRP